MAEQLVKKEGLGYNRVYPKTFIDAIKDRQTGQSLEDILANFNCYFLPYAGDAESTRLQVPPSLRRQGLWITYVLYDGTIKIEYYSSNEMDDEAWSNSKYWMIGTNSLVGDITLSSEGHWIVNGVDTGVVASGEPGISPVLRIHDNRFQVSYNEGRSFVNLDEFPVHTNFRVENNKLQISEDLGETWNDVTEPIAAWFRWVEGDFNTVGKIQISRDKKTWEDLTPSISNTLKVQAYYSKLEDAPETAPEGYIIMIGPYFDESDSPKYELYIYLNSGWFDVGSFQSIQSGITGQIDENSPDSSAVVPTAEAVIDYIDPLKKKVAKLEGQLNGITIEKPLSESDYENKSEEDLKEDSLYFVFENDEEEV